MTSTREQQPRLLGVTAGFVSVWAILLAVVLASIDRMPVIWASILTSASVGILIAARRVSPGILMRWWMWPILLLLALDLAFTWQTVFVYDERTSPATRAKEADARRRAAAAE